MVDENISRWVNNHWGAAGDYARMSWPHAHGLAHAPMHVFVLCALLPWVGALVVSWRERHAACSVMRGLQEWPTAGCG